MPSHCEGNLPRSRENRGLTGQKRRSKQRAIEHKLRKAQEDLRQLQQAAPTLQAVPTAPPLPGPERYAQTCTREQAAAGAAARKQKQLAREVSQTPAAATLSSVNSGDLLAGLLALSNQAELYFEQFIASDSINLLFK